MAEWEPFKIFNIFIVSTLKCWIFLHADVIILNTNFRQKCSKVKCIEQRNQICKHIGLTKIKIINSKTMRTTNSWKTNSCTKKSEKTKHIFYWEHKILFFKFLPIVTFHLSRFLIFKQMFIVNNYFRVFDVHNFAVLHFATRDFVIRNRSIFNILPFLFWLKSDINLSTF